MRRDGTGRRERRERVRGLYVIADTATLAGRDLVASVAAALLGGAAIVQYRDKGGDPELRRAQADALRGLCRRHDALFIVNDDFELALACGADGVHLGRHDDAVALVRREHPELLVGASCYADLARAAQMSAAGADYLAFGSFRASPTKPDAVRADDEILRQARGRFDVPLVAIGGIVEQDVPHLLRCGADAIAVISAVFGQADPRRASAAFAGYFQQHEPATRTSNTGNRTMNNAELFDQARQHIPGGVNSPVRAFKSVGGTPVFFQRGQGSRLWDEEGREYIDYVGSWGPMIIGHAHPAVIEAVKQQLDHGLGFGAPTVIETEMADLVCQLVPSIEKVRMVSSGTEATMSAIRLARGFTGRDTIIKFEGCYHGHSDSLLVKAGSGALTHGVPTSPGVPADLARHTLTLRYNDLEQVAGVMRERGDDIACIIVEPVAGNMNCVPPEDGFLEGLRGLCDDHGSVLIFDEVMTGFRVALGGAQAHYGIRPDLTTLGKVLGGGLPVGAFGGRAEVMDHIAPDGPVYQAGTLSGNPVAMAAGLATLREVMRPDFHADLTARTGQLVAGLQAAAQQAGVAFTTNQVGAMFGLFFSDSAPVTRFTDVMACDTARFAAFYHAMLDNGVYLAPSAFEAGFVSAAHTDADIDSTLQAAEAAFAAIA